MGFQPKKQKQKYLQLHSNFRGLKDILCMANFHLSLSWNCSWRKQWWKGQSAASVSLEHMSWFYLLLPIVHVAWNAEGILADRQEKSLFKKKRGGAWKEYSPLSEAAQEVCYMGGWCACTRERVRDRDRDRDRENKSAISEMFPLVLITWVDVKRWTKYPVIFEQLFVFESEFQIGLHF